MSTSSQTHRCDIDEHLSKARGWLHTDGIEPALCELDEAVRIVETYMREDGLEHPTLQLMKLVNMVHRCRASPSCRAAYADAAHELAMRIQRVSGYGSRDAGTRPPSRHHRGGALRTFDEVSPLRRRLS
jgi:hypothetical protein